MLNRDDVVDVKSEIVEFLWQPAVFALVVRTLAKQLANGGFHQDGQEARTARARDLRMATRSNASIGSSN